MYRQYQKFLSTCPGIKWCSGTNGKKRPRPRLSRESPANTLTFSRHLPGWYLNNAQLFLCVYREIFFLNIYQFLHLQSHLQIVCIFFYPGYLLPQNVSLLLWIIRTLLRLTCTPSVRKLSDFDWHFLQNEIVITCLTNGLNLQPK